MFYAEYALIILPTIEFTHYFMLPQTSAKVKNTLLGTIAFLSFNCVLANSAEANIARPPVYPCYSPVMCDYLVEQVIFNFNADSYCKSKWGRDAYVRSIWGLRFCALPYHVINKKNWT